MWDFTSFVSEIVGFRRTGKTNRRNFQENKIKSLDDEDEQEQHGCGRGRGWGQEGGGAGDVEVLGRRGKRKERKKKRKRKKEERKKLTGREYKYSEANNTAGWARNIVDDFSSDWFYVSVELKHNVLIDAQNVGYTDSQRKQCPIVRAASKRYAIKTFALQTMRTSLHKQIVHQIY